MRTFLQKNWMLVAAIIYLLLPIDIIPESLFGPLGLTDDISLLVIELIRRFFVSRKENSNENSPEKS
ncbi:MAG: DUF1232 domain-containing protein [Candidatus Dojkabacteria bacterium]|nr:MAG: DUF1232 domain-containing protein [Candidatus Dojkabacteria bacterium]